MTRLFRLAAICVLGLVPVVESAAQQPAARPGGIYVKPASAGDDAWTRITGNTIDDVQVNGMAKAALTGGFLKPKVTGTLPGESATTRLTSGDLVFEFRFDEPQRGQPNMDMAAMAAAAEDYMNKLPPNTKKPSDFSLIALPFADGARQLGASKGSFKFRQEQLAPRVFRVVLEAPLPAGEYAFQVGKNFNGGQLWDFAVDAK